MQSEKKEAEDPKQHGHRRMPTMGKAMPVTSLLLDFPPPTASGLRYTHMRDGHVTDEKPPRFFLVEENVLPDPLPEESEGNTEEEHDSDNELQVEQAYELLVSECSSDDENGHGNKDPISLVGNSIFYTPCLTCTGSAPAELAERPSALNEMCRRLCTEECRLRLSLAGLEPPSESALMSRRALQQQVEETLLNQVNPDSTEPTQSPSGSHCPVRVPIKRKQYPLPADSDSECSLDSRQTEQAPTLLEIVASIVTPSCGENGESGKKSSLVDAHELAMLKDFREKYEIAEALAKTSAMTSTTQIKQRLAARKLEIELENLNKTQRESVNKNENDKYSNNSNNSNNNDNDNNNDNYKGNCYGSDYDYRVDMVNTVAVTAANTGAANANIWNGKNLIQQQGDYNQFTHDSNAIVNAQKQQQVDLQLNGNDFEPPRELLLYLVRMGSFNSAPKINNNDSQDDGLEIPKGLSIHELLQHVRILRGEHHPPLLSRFFNKPPLSIQMPVSDIADEMRSLKLNSVAQVFNSCMRPPHHVRVLQWNILSQSLGQNNDGFVCCPEEALSWESRKFLIVQEILQHDPDIICLQEVDHFKFLQNLLGSQRYEGIFFPKPDSPCLYIEENNGPDGCAIFFKSDKYELRKFDTRILEVWRVQSNQVAIAANLMSRATGKEICVCTTHLKARHGSLLSKLRNEQGRDLIRFLKQFGENRPLMLCGDFNAEPIEPVYTTMLNNDLLKLSSAYADIKTEIDDCEIQSVAAEILQEEDIVQDSIKREPPYTTWKIREDGEECHTIDYIFYTQNSFKVRNCLEFPRGEDIGKDRTPSFQYPSDHFSLVCDFEMMDI